jgi:hypothetical protein
MSFELYTNGVDRLVKGDKCGQSWEVMEMVRFEDSFILFLFLAAKIV